MRALAIADAARRRVLRDRTALFFIIVLPVLLIIIVGAVARGFTTFRVGVLEIDKTPASERLVGDLARAPGLSVVSYSSVGSLEKAVGRGEVTAGVVIPRRLDAATRSGDRVTVSLLAEQANTTQQAAATRVMSVIDSYGGEVQAAQFATRYDDARTYAENLATAVALSRTGARVGLASRTIRESQNTLPSGYEYSAPTELVLFVFLSALAAGASIIETRRLGMFERMSAAPIRPSTIIVGESLTYIGIAVVQSALLVAVGALLFGVSWGNPLGAGVLLLLWCLVGASAGMVAGTVFRTPDQASAIAPVVGITFAMLGGCMWPLSIVSPTMRAIGHITPQAWAVDAWTNLLSNHGTLLTIGRELGILAAFAVGLFVIATVRLRAMLRAEGATA